MVLNAFLQPDDIYAPYAGVAITSLFENNKHFNEINIYIVSLAMNKENRDRYLKLAEKYGRRIVFVDVDDIVEYLKSNNMPEYAGSYATYVKLFCISKFDSGIDRMIYIDADMIIDGKMDELVNCDLQGIPCAMALDRTCNFYKKGIGLKENDCYYNAGLIVFNMYEWRKQKCEEKIKNHIENVRAVYPFCDQDLLNVLFSEKVKLLPLKFNYNTDIILYNDAKFYCDIYDTPENYYTIKEIEQAAKEVVVYHCFESIASRPWVKNSSFPNPMKELWDHYLNMSEWSDFEGIEKEFPKYIKLQTIGYKILPKKLYAKICCLFLHKRMKMRLGD